METELIMCDFVYRKLILFLVTFIDTGVGCAAFGHSCYGGHGKRSSEPTAPQLENEQNTDSSPSPPPVPMLRMMQRNNRDLPRLPYQMTIDSTEILNREREVRFLVLNTLKQVIEDSLKNQQFLNSLIELEDV